MAANEAGDVPIESAGVRPSREDPPDLPEPPEIDKRIVFHPTQVAGLVMVGLLPLLSFFGLFGIGRGTVEGTDGTVAVRVEHPTWHRLRVRQPLLLQVTNATDAAVSGVELRVPRSYLSAFADVAFTPGPDRVDARDYVFALADLSPGETRTVTAEMQASGYWRHEAAVSWRVLGEAGDQLDPGSVAFATFVWP